MTSKEVIIQIAKMVASGKIPKKIYNKYLSDTPIGFMSEADLIKYFTKDLELLELIKKHPLEFSWVYQSKNYSDYVLMGGTTLSFRFSDKDFNKIKELLNNEI